MPFTLEQQRRSNVSSTGKAISDNQQYYSNEGVRFVSNERHKKKLLPCIGGSDNEFSIQRHQYSNQSMQRLRNFGSMLSGLSKSSLIVPKKSKRTQSSFRLNKKEQSMYQKRMDRIKAMKQAYVKNKNTNNNMVNQQYRERAIDQNQRESNLDFINNSSQHTSQGIDYKDNSGTENDASMRELIDWLEKVDLNGIHDFV